MIGKRRTEYAVRIAPARPPSPQSRDRPEIVLIQIIPVPDRPDGSFAVAKYEEPS